jgi:predicted tellurium resistance membrane protein TerC
MSINDILSGLSTYFTFDYVLIIIQLIILEGLLSFDNAIALAALVRKNLPREEDRKKALMWGIWGAYILRTVVIFIGVWLMEHKWVQAIAGVYLVYVFVNEIFFSKKTEKPVGPALPLPLCTTTGVEAAPPGLNRGAASENDAHIPRYVRRTSRSSNEGSGPGGQLLVGPRIFWMTVVQVELLDLMFSIDSVAVALAISEVAWVLIIGAVLGILLMRFAAQIFIKLIDKFPLLEKAAFILVGIAGVNVILKLEDLNLGFTRLSINIHIPEPIFFSMMIFVVVVSMALQPFLKKFPKNQ